MCARWAVFVRRSRLLCNLKIFARGPDQTIPVFIRLQLAPADKKRETFGSRPSFLLPAEKPTYVADFHKRILYFWRPTESCTFSFKYLCICRVSHTASFRHTCAYLIIQRCVFCGLTQSFSYSHFSPPRPAETQLHTYGTRKNT